MTNCLVCDGYLLPAKRYPGLLQCKKCEFLTADLNLSHDELKNLYSHDYFHGEEYNNYVDEQDALLDNFKDRLNDILKLKGVQKESKLYEIGCAYGFFLNLASNYFNKTAGIDISEDAVNYAVNTLGLNAESGNFLTNQMPYQPDLICMWDVVEHLKSPDLVIKRAAEVIAPGGYICITTGDIASFVARMRGSRWRMIHPPTHLHYFTPTTLGMILEKNGFDVISVTYPSIKRTIGAILYGVLSLRLGLKIIYNVLAKLPGQEITIPINLYDIMHIVAKRKTS